MRGACFFLLPLWEKVARTKSASDEGERQSAGLTPHPSSLREATLSHKGRGKATALVATYWIGATIVGCLNCITSIFGSMPASV